MNWHVFEITMAIVVIAVLTAALYCQWENERSSYFRETREPRPLKEQLKLLLNFRVKKYQIPSVGKMILLRGTEAAFMRYYAFGRTRPEKILSAAIQHPNGFIYTALNPGRHHHVIRFMSAHKVAGISVTRNQGFLTTHGRFVDRRDGLTMAQQHKQIVKKHPAPWELYSEDMW